jgi:hypothetical protein
MAVDLRSNWICWYRNSLETTRRSGYGTGMGLCMDTNCRKKFYEWKKGNMNIRRWVKEMKRAADTTGLAFVWPNQQKCSIWKIRKLIKYKWKEEKKERNKMMSQRSSLNWPPPRADGKNDCTYTSILSICSYSLARETVTFYWERKRRENVVERSSLKNS